MEERMKEKTKQEIYKGWYDNQYQNVIDDYRDPIINDIDFLLKIPFMHRLYVGGSMTPAIMGVSKWSDIVTEWKKMVGEIDNTTIDDDKRFLFAKGHVMEEPIAQLFSYITKIPHTEGQSLTDVERPWAYVQVDKFTEDGEPLEIKTAFSNREEDGEKVWGKGCTFNGRGEMLTEDDTIPVEYMIQVQKQISFVGDECKSGWLCALIGNEVKPRIYRIHRNQELIDKINKADEEFMFNHVIPHIEPTMPKEEKEEAQELTKKDDKTLFADKEVALVIDEIKEIKASIAKLKEQEEALTKRLETVFDKQLNGEGVICDTEGNTLVSRKSYETNRFNSTKFKNDNAELYKEYLTTTTSYRLTLAKEKK